MIGNAVFLGELDKMAFLLSWRMFADDMMKSYGRRTGIKPLVNSEFVAQQLQWAGRFGHRMVRMRGALPRGMRGAAP